MKEVVVSVGQAAMTNGAEAAAAELKRLIDQHTRERSQPITEHAELVDSKLYN